MFVAVIFQMLAREIIEDSILTYLTSEVLADNIDDNELSQKVFLAKDYEVLYVSILKNYFYPIVK